jgi:hypothetical protein
MSCRSTPIARPMTLASRGISVSRNSFRFHPHWNGLFLEAGFDKEGRFVHIPRVDLQKMSSCFRQRVFAFFLERKLQDDRRAKNMLDWTHSGFWVDAGIRIPATSARTREALAQYLVRAPPFPVEAAIPVFPQRPKAELQ